MVYYALMSIFHPTKIVITLVKKMGIEERSLRRKKLIVANRAKNFQEAEDWDLDFWLKQTPEQRLSALVAIRRDIMKIEEGKIRSLRVKRETDNGDDKRF